MSVLLAIVVVGIGTYAMRAVFIVALAQRSFPVLALRTLEYVAPAVMGALIVSMLTTSEGAVDVGIPEIAGLASAALVAARTRNQIYALLSAMTVFWSLSAFLS